MRISKKGDYALRALVYLAMHAGGGVVQMQEIADKEGIPRKFLEQILRLLRTSGYLNAKSGVGGGYSLRLPPDEIIVGRIVRLIDGPLAPVGCVSVTAHVACPKERTCGLRSVMLDVRNITADILDHITIADVCNRARGIAGRKTMTLKYRV